MKNRIRRIVVIAGILAAMLPGNCSFAQTGTIEKINLKVDGSKELQQVDGFGVNAHTHSWRGNELEPALELLLDSMNATIWRVIVETVVMWEDVNDNDNPFSFNWDYYNKLYETPKFKKVWGMLEYLNRHGITDKLMINFMGPVPSWMGMGDVVSLKIGGDIIEPKFEDEYVEMLLSFFIYAREEKHLKFGLVSLFNETDLNGKEGPKVGAQQYTRILHKLIVRMEKAGLGNVNFIAPDVADMTKGIKDYIPALMKDSVVMSKVAHFGLHSYGGYYADVNTALKNSANAETGFWITEWNAWRNGLDDGQIGLYGYSFASQCVEYLLDLIKNGASAALVWEAYDSYYEHHYPSPFSYWGILGYNPLTKTYSPRKHFYAISQVSRFVPPGSVQIAATAERNDLQVLAFHDLKAGKVVITGINKADHPVEMNVAFSGLPEIQNLEFYYTDSIKNLYREKDVEGSQNTFTQLLPAKCIFTFTGAERKMKAAGVKPEPAGWYAGDMHVHRNCGGDSIVPEEVLKSMMEVNDLTFISLLADMGNAEVKPSQTDLPKVNGLDAPESSSSRILHWDAEWHFDPAGVTFENKAIGGHLVLLGLNEALPIWEESPYKILEWAKEQNAVTGFCHMQYLDNQFQDELNCCSPLDFPVEAALGTIDFLAEDVWMNDAAVNNYYKLLNCGFRLGWAAGTDFPCNNSEPLGSLLTYVQIEDEPATYQNWIEGIKNGKTVVSLNGHNEFINLKINGHAGPGDEIELKNSGNVEVEVTWTSAKDLSGTVEIVCNGKVVAGKKGTAKPGEPLVFKQTLDVVQSSWICARRMNENGHQSHTAPAYITVNNQPVRASSADALYFAGWMDNMIRNSSPGGIWSHYFTHDQDKVLARYNKAKSIYESIAQEAQNRNNQ